ncbi:aminoglycoside phosphotransferase [Verticillium dahliae]
MPTSTRISPKAQTMPPTIELLGRGHITMEDALEEEKNVINWVSYGPATDKLYRKIWEARDTVAALVVHHMGVGRQANCIVLPPDQWIRGSFNVCVFVEVTSGTGEQRKAVFRCPLPHKLAESEYPGSVDEKISCEVGAYAWIEENCPEIPSPHLFGFGFSDGRHYTHSKHTRLFDRVSRRFWCYVYKCFRLPLLSQYVCNPPNHQVQSAYMVLEYLGHETGEMLSNTFAAGREDGARRQRLFRGISQVILSLARIPQAQIGSFQFNNNGTITLTNRPLLCSMMISENDGAARIIRPNDTYSCTDSFVSDMLTFHDHRFLRQANAVYSQNDCRGQMTVKTLLRVLSPVHIKRELRDGPFRLQFTDLHASNILVDKEWNVTGIIDLEWICSLPLEMLDVPYWLTGCAIDQITGDELERFDEIRREFMRIFEEEERTFNIEAIRDNTLSHVMRDLWESKGVWFWHCISSVNAMYFILESHLYPAGSLPLEAERCVSGFWCRDSEDVVRMKLAEKQAYDDELRKLFLEER